MMFSILTVLFAFLSYNQVIGSQKFLYLFSNLVPKSALLLMMSMRFIPLLLRRFRNINAVQKTRGINPRRGSWLKRFRDGALQLKILLTWSLEEALQTADSIYARGYGRGKRSSYHRFRMNREDWFCMTALIGTMLVCVAGWLLGYGELVIYPELADWRPQGLQWVTYGSFCLYLGIPLFIEGKGYWLWRF